MKPDNYDEMSEFASIYGFETEWSPKTGYSFRRDAIRIWNCATYWQCADLVDGFYQNHRPLKSLKDIFEREGAA